MCIEIAEKLTGIGTPWSGCYSDHDKKFKVEYRDDLETVLELEPVGSNHKQKARELRVVEEEEDQSDSEEFDGEEEEVAEDICWQYPTGPAAAAPLPNSHNGPNRMTGTNVLQLPQEPVLSERHTELQTATVSADLNQQELSSDKLQLAGDFKQQNGTLQTHSDSHNRQQLTLYSSPNHYETTL